MDLVSEEGARDWRASTLAERLRYLYTRLGVGQNEFARMCDLMPVPAQPSIWMGPDGIKVDSQGNIFAAYYMGGHVVKMSSEGEFLQRYAIPGIGVTNLTFYPDDNSMYVTAVEDLSGAPFHGSIWKIELNRQ